MVCRSSKDFIRTFDGREEKDRTNEYQTYIYITDSYETLICSKSINNSKGIFENMGRYLLIRRNQKPYNESLGLKMSTL